MPECKQLSDQELAILLKSGDKHAFEEIYNRYWAVLYLHARNILRNQEEAKDVVQELFTTIWSKASDISLQGSLSSYLYRATRNKILNYFEHKKIVLDYQQSLLSFMEEGVLVTDKALREKELTKIIESEIQRLPAKMREIFELSRKRYLSYKQIAEQLDISEHTVRSQVSNSLRILRMRVGATSLIFYLFFLSV